MARVRRLWALHYILVQLIGLAIIASSGWALSIKRKSRLLVLLVGLINHVILYEAQLSTLLY